MQQLQCPGVQEYPNAICRTILPIAKPVAAKVLEHLDQETMQAKQCSQAQLAFIGVGNKGYNHGDAKPNRILGFVPPIKDSQGERVR